MLASLPVLVAALLAWLIGSESGLHTSLGVASRLSGERLQVNDARGRLLGPLQLGKPALARWRSSTCRLSNL